MKLLMTGPGKGANIKIWLDYFNSQRDIEFYFLSDGKYEFDPEKYNNVHLFDEVRWSSRGGKIVKLAKLMWKLRRSDFDVMHIHGMYSLPLTFLYMLSTPQNKRIINIWGEGFVDAAANPQNNFIKKAMYSFIFKHSDKIFINWWGVYNKFCRLFPQHAAKVCVTPWGINEELLSVPVGKAMDLLTERFNIKPEHIVIGSVRGIVALNNQDMVLDTLQILRDRLDPAVFQRFKVLLINGVNFEGDYVKKLQTKVKALGLEQTVTVDADVILNNEEIAAFHERVDIELITSSVDQLSNTIIEGMNRGTFLIMSNIEPYRIFDEKYNLGLDLIELNSHVLADTIEAEVKNILGGRPTRTNYFEKLQGEFIFENNVKRVIGIYHTLKK